MHVMMYDPLSRFLTVATPSATLALSLASSCTGIDVKKVVESKTGIPTEEQRLLYGKKLVNRLVSSGCSSCDPLIN